MPRFALWVFGWLAFGLGWLGLFIPGLPGTPFFILAAYCFSKASPRWHVWLLSRPVIGPMILEWEKNRVIPPRVKATALSMIVLAVGLSWTQLSQNPENPLWVRIVILIAAGLGSAYILKQRSRPGP